MADPHCSTCGGAMVRKSPSRLVLVGLVMAAAPAAAATVPYLWAPAIISASAGLYLIAWAALGKGTGAGSASGSAFSVAVAPPPDLAPRRTRPAAEALVVSSAVSAGRAAALGR